MINLEGHWRKIVKELNGRASPQGMSLKKIIASSTTKYYPITKKFLILFLFDTTRSITITPSDFPFLLPWFDFLFLLCCLVLGLLELGPLAFGVRWVFFLGGWFAVPHVYGNDFHLYVYPIYTTPCIYLFKNLNRTLFF